ncbi:uncharacterized protein LOC128241048 [Mya arenaria]|uniref:uncharacterized protein LOC128241048 n=1 Tax=Mya arenaria TaxID=6604 RepID=UPI0022E4742A|nr:uncharacterized protein LOC128241048 [Mya arenaria]
MPKNCACSGQNHLIPYQSNIQGDGTGDVRRQCLHTDSYYKGIYDQFYPDNGNNAPSCRTHHSLWYNLSRVSTAVIAGDSTTSCLIDIVYHLNLAGDMDGCRRHDNDYESKTHQ